MAQAQKFELFMGCLGNGITVCNKAVMEHGDFKKVCHISPEGQINWYVAEDCPPPADKERIMAAAQREKEKYQVWFSSLPEWKQREIELDKKSGSGNGVEIGDEMIEKESFRK